MPLPKKFGEIGAAVGGLLLLVALIVAFVAGIAFVVKFILPIVRFLGALGFLLALPLILSAAFIKRTRKFCGEALVLISLLWGFSLWFEATALLFSYWGSLGFFVGVFLFGFGSVPLACIVLLFHGEFAIMFSILTFVALIFGVRYLGVWFEESYESRQTSELWGQVFEAKRKSLEGSE